MAFFLDPKTLTEITRNIVPFRTARLFLTMSGVGRRSNFARTSSKVNWAWFCRMNRLWSLKTDIFIIFSGGGAHANRNDQSFHLFFLVSTKKRRLCQSRIFWACAHFRFLTNFLTNKLWAKTTGSLWIGSTQVRGLSNWTLIKPALLTLTKQSRLWSRERWRRIANKVLSFPLVWGKLIKAITAHVEDIRLEKRNCFREK